MKSLIEAVLQKKTLISFSTQTRMSIMLKPKNWMALFSLWIVLVAGAAQAGTELYFVHSDHLGTAKVLTNHNQEVVWQADYSPFGEVVETSDEVEFRQRFLGQYYDQESNLYYNYYRDYDPSTGRYIQSDPIGLKGGINTYAYVENNPIVQYDPLGLWSINLAFFAGGRGGTLKFGRSNGRNFIQGGLGFGMGWGATFDPNGSMLSPSSGTGSNSTSQQCSPSAVVIAGVANANITRGPFSASVTGYAGGYSSQNGKWQVIQGYSVPQFPPKLNKIGWSTTISATGQVGFSW